MTNHVGNFRSTEINFYSILETWHFYSVKRRHTGSEMFLHKRCLFGVLYTQYLYLLFLCCDINLADNWPVLQIRSFYGRLRTYDILTPANTGTVLFDHIWNLDRKITPTPFPSASQHCNWQETNFKYKLVGLIGRGRRRGRGGGVAFTFESETSRVIWKNRCNASNKMFLSSILAWIWMFFLRFWIQIA